MVNFLVGWSGFSVHSQALSFISNTDINGKLYLFAKFLHGCLSSIYTFILYTFKYKNMISPSFYPYSYPIDPIYTLEWPYLIINSFKLAILMTIYLLISSLIMLLIECFISSLAIPLSSCLFSFNISIKFLNPPGYQLKYYQHTLMHQGESLALFGPGSNFFS